MFDPAGERVATTYQQHPLHYPRPGWVEQDPRDWRAALVNGFRDLSARVNLRRVRAISFGSQLDGLVCVDAASQPVGPAIIWMDRRADPLCREAEQRVAADEWYRRSGCNLDGSHVAAKLAWVARERPDQYARTARALLPGAYMVCVACGADAVDRSNASSTMLLDPDRGDWDAQLLDAFGIDAAPAAAGGRRRAAGRRGHRRLRRVDRPGRGHAGDLRLRRRDGGHAWAPASPSQARSATCWAPPSRSAPSPTGRCATTPGGRAATPTPRRAAGCSRTRAGASGADYRWFRDELGPEGGGDGLRLYESLNRPGARRPASEGARGCPGWAARWRRSGRRTRAAAGSG